MDFKIVGTSVKREDIVELSSKFLDITICVESFTSKPATLKDAIKTIKQSVNQIILFSDPSNIIAYKQGFFYDSNWFSIRPANELKHFFKDSEKIYDNDIQKFLTYVLER